MLEALSTVRETMESTKTSFLNMLKNLDKPLKSVENIDSNENIESSLSELDKPLNNSADANLGDKVSYDDNGNPFKDQNGLLPNTTYFVNGYEYKTDHLGRIISSSGEIHLTDRTDRKTINESISNIGKGDERLTDARGHLIADRFDGSYKIENLVPMDATLNNGDYKAMENKLADAVKDGKETTLKVEPIYEGDSHRPSTFLATYSIDGVESVMFYRNGGNS